MRMLTVMLLMLLGIASGDEFAVLPEEVTPGVPKGEMLGNWLQEQAYQALDQREAAFETLDSPEARSAWQTQRREAFIEALGGFPQRTPLRPVITGELKFDDYRIEKLYFESQPGLHVTANLYLPSGQGPFPAVLHPTGHSASAKNRDLYQAASIVVAKAGCAVLCYDPIGQGERDQAFRPDGKPYASTQQHMLIQQGAALLGTNTAQTMVWDGMRAIDYLQSRPDILRDKIGCMGISGGGTNTSYLMALDERIRVAAPGCYLTGYRSLLSTIGPQDAEQNIHGQLAFGMDHADYVLMRLPKPTLIMAATSDYFDIQGAWNLYREGKRFATNQGFPERVDLVEANTEHGFPPEMQLAAANWFRRWLLEIDEPITLPEVVTLPEEELNVTLTGSVLDLEGARSIFEIHAEQAAALPQTKNVDMATVREVIGARNPEQLPDYELEELEGTAESQDSEGRRQPLVLTWDDGIRIPGILFLPEGQPDWSQALIYLNPEGKENAMELAQDRPVLAVDLRGFGETQPSTRRSYSDIVGPDWAESAIASLLGRSCVGMRVEDLWQCVRYLREATGQPDLEPGLIAVGEAGIPALHAAALTPDWFGEVTVQDSLTSWRDVVGNPSVGRYQSHLVYDALRHYDLTDLVESE